jgi:hypothetical protein
VLYVDRFGNAITGVRATVVQDTAALAVNGRSLPQARTFSATGEGSAFWYANSNGLVEIAVNRGRADETLGLRVGTPVSLT